MKIAVYGENRLPVLPKGPGGLGRSTHMLATGLQSLGHEVTLHALPGSEFAGPMLATEPDPAHYDAVLDFSHEHRLSRLHLSAPVENLLGDSECRYVPPQAVVESTHMQKKYRGAQLVPASVDVAAIPFTPAPAGGYLLFMARMHPLKGVGDALKIHELTGMPVKFVGPGGEGMDLPDYLGPVYEDAPKWELLGNALALLCPYYEDAAPRTPLEAAACGTPTLCYKRDGTQEHIHQGLTGFACLNFWEMADRIHEAIRLDRAGIRAWVESEHNLPQALAGHEQILQRIKGGVRW